MPGHYGGGKMPAKKKKTMKGGKKGLPPALKKNYRQKEKEKVMTHHNHEGQKWHVAEELNGRLAMLGFVIAIGTYITTGQIIPGIL